MSFRLALVFGILLTVTGFTVLSLSDNEAQPKTRLLITGSSTIAPLAAEIAKRFEAENPDFRIDVETGGSSRGLADVRNGLADIGMVSRALKSNEHDVKGYLLARDGVAMIVHADNPISSLSENEIKAIYRDEINDWSSLGGKAGPISVVHKAEGRSTLEVFLHHFALSNEEVVADVIIGDNEQGIKTVSASPTAIGYVSIGAAEIAIESGTPIRLLPLMDVTASTTHVADGTFPITRELNFVTGPTPSAEAKAFLRYAQSDAVDDLIGSLSFVPPRR